MKAIIVEKHKTNNDFYIKPIRGGYYMIIDRFDMDMAGLEDTKEAAEKLCEHLNELRRNRLTQQQSS